MRKDLRIAEAAVVDHQHHGLCPLAIERPNHLSLAAVAEAKDGVRLRAEVVQHLIMRKTAAVETDIEDDRFLVEIVRVERTHKPIEAGFVHARNVNVAEL